jgi:uncharacterized Zn finger protein
MAPSTMTSPSVMTADPSFVRLASCPRCGSRRRVLMEAGSQITGRCLNCGADMPAPLEVEIQGHAVLVGRAGQDLVEVGAGR